MPVWNEVLEFIQEDSVIDRNPAGIREKSDLDIHRWLGTMPWAGDILKFVGKLPKSMTIVNLPKRRKRKINQKK